MSNEWKKATIHGGHFGNRKLDAKNIFELNLVVVTELIRLLQKPYQFQNEKIRKKNR